MTADATSRMGRTPWRARPARDRLTQWAVVTVDGLVAVTAVAGGVALSSGLEDDNLGRDLLAGTPFESYLWPGVALGSTVGASAAVATALTIRRHRLSGVASILAGTVLAGWVAVEIALLDQPSEPTTTEVVYLTAAALMAALGACTVAGAGRARSAREQR